MTDLATQTVNIPIPPVQLPLLMVAVPVNAADGSMVVQVVAQNPSGASVMGFCNGDQAQAYGQQLMALGRECQTRLVKPPKALILPDGSARAVPDAPESEGE